jgi:DNA-binding beta-propeller fold protein YncE
MRHGGEPSGTDLHRRPARTDGVDRREFVALAAAAPLALRSSLAAAATVPPALVTCDAEARLALVDLARFRIARSLPCRPDPRSAERVGTQAVVCHTAVGAVSIVDGSGRIRHVLGGFVEPRYTAAHPNGRLAFVTDSGRSSVATVDAVRGELLGRVRLSGWARHISVDRAGRTLWISLGSASPDVAVVDVSVPARPRHVATIAPPFAAHDVGFSPDLRHVWVTSGDRGAAGIFDLRGRIRVPLAADLAPQHVTFSESVAFVTSGDSGTLHVQRLADGRVLRRTRIPVGSYNVQYGFRRVLTPSLDRGTLAVLDAGGRLLAEVQVSSSCHDACFLPGAN